MSHIIICNTGYLVCELEILKIVTNFPLVW